MKKLKRAFISKKLRPHVKASSVQMLWSNKRQMLKEDTDILLIGAAEDGTTEHFSDFLQEKEVKHQLIHPEYAGFADLVSWNTQGSALDRFESIYVRCPGSTDPDLMNTLSILTTLMATHKGTIINRPSAPITNHSKPLQTSQIANLKGPVKHIPTVVTNDPLSLPNEKRDYIVKSISSRRSKVVTLSDRQLSSNKTILDCPIQIQPKLDGFNIRAHVIKDKVVALKLDSQKVDYRYGGKTKVSVYKLPQQVEDWCCELAILEGLIFAGIDLYFVPKEETFYCFEVNPSPGYSYYETKLLRTGNEPLISQYLLSALRSN